MAQKPSKKDAKAILNKSWNCIKYNDSAAFVTLWGNEELTKTNPVRPHSNGEIHNNLFYLRDFLRVAIENNMDITFMEIEKNKLDGTDTKYWVKAWFKNQQNTYIGYGFYIAYEQNKWVVRDYPSTSRLSTGYSAKFVK